MGSKDWNDNLDSKKELKHKDNKTSGENISENKDLATNEFEILDLTRLSDAEIFANNLLNKNTSSPRKNKFQQKLKAGQWFYNYKKHKPVLNISKFETILKVYFRRQFWKDLLMLILASFLLTIGYDYFIGATGKDGLFPPGLGAIARQISFFMPGSNNSWATTWYFAFYIILNVPLLIFGLLKVGIKFSVLTVFALILQNIFNIIVVNIPFINPESFKVLINFKINYDNVLEPDSPIYLIWIFVFSIFGAIIYGFGYAFLYKAGASSSGTDFISAYYQKKYRISIATINRSVNIGIVLLIILIHGLTMSKEDLMRYFNRVTDIDVTKFRVRYIFGPTTFATLTFVVIQAITINWIYPKYKYLNIVILSNKSKQIREALVIKGFMNPISITKAKMIIKDQEEELEKLNINISMTDFKKLVLITKVVDKNAQIISRRIDKIIGRKIILE